MEAWHVYMVAHDFGVYSNILGAQMLNPATFGDFSSSINSRFMVKILCHLEDADHWNCLKLWEFLQHWKQGSKDDMIRLWWSEVTGTSSLSHSR